MEIIEDIFTISSGQSLEEAAASDFILRNGSDIISELSEETSQNIGKIPAPIKLRVGNEKWGLRHIEMRHGEEIKEAGFKNATAFIAYVLDNASRFFDAGRKDRIILVEDISIKSKGTALIELELRDNFYEVLTAHRMRERNLKSKKSLVLSRTQDNPTLPERQPIEPGTSPQQAGTEAGECYGTSETKENISLKDHDIKYLTSESLIASIHSGHKIEKRDLEQLREAIVVNRPEENDPLRKSARSIMLRFQDKSDNHTVDQRTALRMVEIFRESSAPSNKRNRNSKTYER